MEKKLVRKKKKKVSSVEPTSRLSCLIITGIFIFLAMIFTLVLSVSGILPTKYLILLILLFVGLAALIAFLTYRPSRKIPFISGIVLFCLLSVSLIYGMVAISKVVSTLETIATPKAEMTKIGVYVLKDDPAKTLEDLDGLSFGILAEQERANTDKVIEQINEKGVKLTTKEYPGLPNLVDGLYNQECRAIILNRSYLEVLEEMDGYEDIRERIREVAVFNIEGEAKGAKNVASDKAFTMYISGIDSRDGLITKSRSDVNIMATVNTETRQILLVTTPRDYFVELPISNGAKDKLTHAGIYGVDVSMETLAMLYDLESVDYYFRISFEGTVDIVDALGGVSVYSELPFTAGGYNFVQGSNKVNGTQALAFARERYSFESGDRQRGKNQMALIRAIIKKASSPSILVNYSSLLSAMEGNFETSMSYSTIASLASEQLSSGERWEVISYSVDGEGATEVPYSMSMPAYVMIPDETTVTKAKEMMNDVLSGKVITQP